jgi:NitT/TauT family transport system substrate-binding protein
MACFGKETFMKFIVSLLASIFLVSSASAAQPKSVKLQLALNWKAEPEFGGFYAAKLAGYFEKRGLNVDITEGGAGTPVVQMVANRKVPFGIAAGDEVVIAQSRGADVVALFAVYQINPQGIMVHPERGFKSIADVFSSPGILAIQSGSPHTLFLQAKYPKANVKLVPYAGGIAQFLTDPNYSQQCFVTSEPLLAKKKSVAAKSFLIADEGFKPYGTVVVARRDYVEKNPQRARDFIDAVRDGWREYLRVPEKANALMVKLNPAIDADTMKAADDVQKPFIVPAGAQAGDLGKMTADRWTALTNQLQEIKLIKSKPAADRLFQNF